MSFSVHCGCTWCICGFVTFPVFLLLDDRRRKWMCSWEGYPSSHHITNGPSFSCSLSAPLIDSVLDYTEEENHRGLWCPRGLSLLNSSSPLPFETSFKNGKSLKATVNRFSMFCSETKSTHHSRSLAVSLGYRMWDCIQSVSVQL